MKLWKFKNPTNKPVKSIGRGKGGGKARALLSDMQTAILIALNRRSHDEVGRAAMYLQTADPFKVARARRKRKQRRATQQAQRRARK